MSKRPEELPTQLPDDGHGTRFTHPAFGQIVASRITGHRNLYASDFDHHGFVRITISRSQLRRDLSHDWHFGEKELIEVDLSEAQWATFVSAMNIGSGVPCTINYIKGEGYIPDVPRPDRREQFKAEFNERLKDGFDAIKEAREELNKLGLSGPKRKMIEAKLNRAETQLGSNLTYVANQFEEHVEDTVERGKAEAHGYITRAVTQAGLSALGAPPETTMIAQDKSPAPTKKIILKKKV